MSFMVNHYMSADSTTMLNILEVETQNENSK